MKKYGLLIGLVVLLLVAVYVNVRINKAQDSQTPAPTSSPAAQSAQKSAAGADEAEYFATFRENRESLRDEHMEVLESIINNKDTDSSTLADAQKEKLALADMMEKELSIESQVTAKGFADAAVTIDQDNVTIVVKSDSDLTEKQVAQIYDIICRVTDVDVKNIKIIPSKAN